jgi:hypothetical protein
LTYVITVVREGPTSVSNAKKTRNATALQSTPSTTTATHARAWTPATRPTEPAAKGA